MIHTTKCPNTLECIWSYRDAIYCIFQDKSCNKTKIAWPWYLHVFTLTSTPPSFILHLKYVSKTCYAPEFYSASKICFKNLPFLNIISPFQSSHSGVHGTENSWLDCLCSIQYIPNIYKHSLLRVQYDPSLNRPFLTMWTLRYIKHV